MSPQNPTASSRTPNLVLAIFFVLPLAALLLLRATDVPLGQGSFYYRFSPIQAVRILRCWPMLLLAPACAALPYLLTRRRILGLVTFFLLLPALCAWTWWAPPRPLTQHMLNLRSPSQEGAFVNEAETFSSLSQYLQNFDSRLQRSAQEMLGVRILSNPPGMTILAHGLSRLFDSADAPDALERYLISQHDIAPEHVVIIARSLRMSIALCLLWAGSSVFSYLLGRLFLPPAAAALFALVVTFNPSTVHFSPGKDPAQLLTTTAMLWALLAAWKRQSPILWALAGALLMIGMSVGLIQLWIALAALLAVLWHECHAASHAKTTISLIAFALLGAGIVLTIAYLLWGWNMLPTLLAVARRYPQIQRQIHLSQTIWLVIGLPIFLLFLSPVYWACAVTHLPPPRSITFGLRLLLSTLAVMLLTYFLAVTYELPRLWIPFLPLLLLGFMIDNPLLGVRDLRPLALMLVVHIAFTALHWTLLDVRESEYRLSRQDRNAFTLNAHRFTNFPSVPARRRAILARCL